MKRDFTFVFILLAILSMVNAIPYQLHKRDTTFIQCPKSDASLLTVSVSPDPPVPGQIATYTISGELAKAAPVGSTIVIRFADVSSGEAKVIGVPSRTDLCSKVECPASSINIVEEVAIPADLPYAYANSVSIIDSDNRYGCSVAVVGGNGGGAAPNA